jgi:hypothetical protein
MNIRNTAKTRRPFKGNKYLIQSHEYQDLNQKLFQIQAVVGQMQQVLMAMVQAPQVLDGPVDTSPTEGIPQDVWDKIEDETDSLAANDAEYATVAAELDRELQAIEAVQEALAPQEAL